MVFLESENLPKAILENPCSALTADVKEESSMLKTKVKIVLKDCFNKVLYTSAIGESRKKDFNKSYQEAIRNAHSSMKNIIFEKVAKTETVGINSVENESPNSKNTIKSKIPIVEDNSIKELKENSTKTTNVLYAQPKENGFQLINLKPEVVLVILNTSLKDVYLLSDKNGILYKKETYWVAEYYKDGKLVTEQYQIKF